VKTSVSEYEPLNTPQEKVTLEQFEKLVSLKMPSFKAMIKREHWDGQKPIEEWAKMYGLWLEDPR
jgi:hypothetical protein